MANNLNVGDNIVFPLVTGDYEDAGFNETNCKIIWEYQPGVTPRSWRANREINPSTGLETGLNKGYNIIMKTAGDFTACVVAASQILNPDGPYLLNKTWSGRSVVFIGDSITYGAHANSNATRWTSRLAQAYGGTEINLGIPGETMQNGSTSGTAFDQATIPTKTPTHLYLFIALGTNDIGINNGTLNPASFKTKYLSVIDHAVGKGWPAGNIILVTPPYISTQGYDAYDANPEVIAVATPVRHEQYVAAVKEVAATKNTLLADVYARMKLEPNRDGMLASSDGLHPNDIGHAYIAEFLNYGVKTAD